MTEKQLNCVIIGSFRKYYPTIVEVVDLLTASGITVLSPAKSNIINPEADFVRLEQNPVNATDKDLQSEVFLKMEDANLVYLVNPGGYFGITSAFEFGYCVDHDIPVYLMEASGEQIAQYAAGIKTPRELCEMVK